MKRVVAVLLLAASVAAQRGRVSGVCRLDEGKPWAGAKVVFVAHPSPGRLRGSDRVETEADARGRFRADLVRGRAYTAWAWSKLDAGYRVSRLANSAWAGGRLRLVAAGTQPEARLVIHGLEAWARLGPLSVVLVSAEGSGVGLRCKLVDDVVVLPALPGSQRLVVLGKGGLPVVSADIRRSGEPDTQLDIARPRQLVVRVESLDGHDAIAGAGVFVRLEDAWWQVGKTDAKGIAVVTQHESVGTRRSRQLVAAAPGFAEAVKFWNGKPAPDRDVLKLAASGKADVTIQCQKGRSVRGQVLWTNGEPAAGLDLLLYASIASGRGSYSHFRTPRRLVTDAEGRFESAAIHERLGWRLFAVPGEARLAELAGDAPLCPMLWIALGALPPDKPLTIRIDQLRSVEFRVTHADGSPARYPRLRLTDRTLHPGGGIGCVYTLPFDVGKRGVLRLLMPRTDTLCAGAAVGGAFAGKELDLAAAGDELVTVELKMPQGTYLEGRVLGTNSKAVAGATVKARFKRSGGSGIARIAGEILQDVSATCTPDGRFQMSVPLEAIVRIQALCRDSKGRVTRGGWESYQVSGEPLRGIEIRIPVKG